ncbi:GNAT family N-acetyltransferase [Flavobacterium cupreum]|uniref:GNAT family N-acetyltransferase n=1 Tax=Flavobacterium cupreum TaxID=2133766 RepID=A0A434ADK8_9FLAO|nr:GNAT family N-acetyltransferase [Flavobacterium cupreum]RUT72450.1 GNAT family N-acetyltransferase [Flavobacterium cupreum]
MSLIHIRKAEITDAKSLSELICENARKILKPHYSEVQWEIFIKYYAVETMATKITTQLVFCAEKDDEIVGTIALDGDFIVGFYTRLQSMNQGIGKLLITSLENHALNSGLTKLQLASTPEGLDFYYKNGWQKVKNFTVNHYGVEFEETLMVKELKNI